MPPKDDDDPASTKEEVTKKQKQLLNREELDLNLIAESLGGFLIERSKKSKKYGETPRGGGGGFGGSKPVKPKVQIVDPRHFLPDPKSKVRNRKPKKPTPGGPRVNPGPSPFDLSKKAKDAKFFDKLGTPAERAAAEQQAAIDMQADKASGRTGPRGPKITPQKRFSDLSKAVKNVKPSVVRGAGRLVAPAAAVADVVDRTSKGQRVDQAAGAAASGWAGASLASKGAATKLAPLLAAPFPGARPLYAGLVGAAGIAGYYAGAGAFDKVVPPKVKPPKVKPVPKPDVEPSRQPEVEPTPQREEDPKRKPNQKPNRPGSGLRTPSRINVGSKSQTPGKNQSPNNTLAPVLGATTLGTGVVVGTALKGGKKGGGGRLPSIGLPGYRGKIGRRSNPQ